MTAPAVCGGEREKAKHTSTKFSDIWAYILR